MNMLDYSSGKPKLVNVYPYCNQVLGDTEKENVQIWVGAPEEVEEERPRRK